MNGRQQLALVNVCTSLKDIQDPQLAGTHRAGQLLIKTILAVDR